MKNKKVLIAIGVVIVILAITGGVVFFLQKKGNEAKPEAVLNNYFELLGNESYNEMYALITDEAKQKITEEDFVKRNKNIYSGIEASNLKISVEEISKIDNDTTNVKYKNTMDTVAGNVEFENTARLTKKDGKYYLDWSSNIIYPSLNDTDKVKVTTKNANRGKILDRNGTVLAGEGTVSSVGFVPGKMNSDTKESDIEKVASLLDISVESINKSLSASYVKDDTFVPIKNVSKDSNDLKQNLLNIKGIKITDAKARVYTYGEELGHLIGYVQNITAEELKQNSGKGYTSQSMIGKSGIEKIYEDRLKGTNGATIMIYDSSDTQKGSIASISEKDGEDIKLTIDAEIQKGVYQQYKDEKSASVVMNPKTGELLALVSTPTFNSNDFVLGMGTSKWNELSNDESKPMYNRFLGSFVPGSSFKPVIGAIGLTTNTINESDDLGKSGTKWQKDSSWGDHYITTLTEYSNPANLQNALIYSDNIFFAKLALKIGSDTLKNSLNKIFFNQSIDFGLVTNKSQYANNSTFSSEGALADTGYGQAEVLVNPVHMASIYSAFVNEGNMIKPYIEYKEEAQPEYLVKEAFSKESAETIKNDLIQVVENANGTANSAKIQGVTIAGKTGTAEIKKSQDDTEGTEIGWFNAFTVGDNAKNDLLMISMVDDVKNKGGSHYVIPKVKSIFQQYAK